MCNSPYTMCLCCMYIEKWSFFFRNNFSTTCIVSSFTILLGLTGFWICSFLMIEVSEVFFILFLQGICCWSGVTLDKLSPCPDKTETLKLSLQISIYLGFSILVLLLDKKVLEIDPDLATVFTVFSVPVLWVDLDLSNNLTLSDLLLLGVSTVLLNACEFSVFLPSPHCVLFYFFSTMSVLPSLATVSVVATNAFSDSSKSPLLFLTFSLGLSYFFGNGSLIFDDMISVIDLLHPFNSRIKVRFY